MEDNEIKTEWLYYLDDLRESGVTNMFGAAPFLVDVFGLQARDARKVLVYWMETFEVRHREG